MCVTVVLDDEEIGGVRRLGEVIGLRHVAIDPDVWGTVDAREWLERHGDSCLCGVDTERTAFNAGMVEVKHDGDPMQHRWRRQAS